MTPEDKILTIKIGFPVIWFFISGGLSGLLLRPVTAVFLGFIFITVALILINRIRKNKP